MIVPMLKVFIATQSYNQARLMDILAQLGVVHIEPVDPNKAVAEEKILHTLSTFEHAIQILQRTKPSGKTPDISPLDAANETITINKTIMEQKEQLGALHRQASQLAIWGNVELKQLNHLRHMGIEIRFFSAARKDLAGLEAECIEVVGELSSREVLIAVIDRIGTFQLPEGAKEIPWPHTDLPSIKKEAAAIDAALKQNDKRLSELANLTDKMRNEQKKHQAKSEFHIAQNSGLTSKALFAIQGWVPSDKADLLSENLSRNDITAAVKILPVEEGETPPTLIEYPGWAKPIKGLFDMLGTVAGYQEFDVAVPFMIALPIFAAMLIGDGGYGLVLVIGLLLAYKKMASALGEYFTRLLIIIGGATFVWGLICNSFFGFPIFNKTLFVVDMTDKSRYAFMALSFAIGAIHLSIAQFWGAIRLYPDLRFLNKVGWGIFIWGMMGVVRMFVLNTSLTWGTPWPYLLITGAALAILFNTPSKNIVKMLLLGVANFPLSMLGAFSDVISYARLMAVGLAGGVLAISFNDLAMGSDANPNSWLIAVPIMICGHALNLGLAMVSLFSHGVRLNMLEFSNNLGMQWSGYSYKPFKVTQE
jgi:V/A-type H+/Na+-transporting ATPase subunit I